MGVKHTPGPWEVDVLIDHGRYKNRRIMSREYGRVAEAAIFPYPEVEDYEGEANARLIAAAPDLLEACAEARNLLNEGRADPAWGVLDRAIAKAGGE